MILEDKTATTKILIGLNMLEGKTEGSFTLFNLCPEDMKKIKNYLSNYNVNISDSDILSKYNLSISKREQK